MPDAVPSRPELLAEIDRLRASVAGSDSAPSHIPSRPHDRLTTVNVPPQFQQPFLAAQEYVERYFANRVEDPTRSTISISGERYILVRAASMSVEFFDLVISLYHDRGPDEAHSVASNLLFDIAHAIGKADAKSFHAMMGVTDPIARLSAGPIHFSFSGWAFVDILPESRPTPDENCYLIYDHPFSFESDSWIKRGRRSDFPVCIMNCGYSSGWCEESFGIPLVAAEIQCQACGDPHCRFIMAPPDKIEEHLLRHRQRALGHNNHAHHPLHTAPVSIPEFFQRKRLEEALRESHSQLEQRVRERTAELVDANRQLQAEIVERRDAERRQTLMMRELDHRVKNNLAAVLSIADKTVAAASTLQDFRKAFSGRITALARTHEALARNKWTGLDLRPMVVETLSPFARHDKDSITIIGEAVTLPAEAANAMCIAVHELATNAAKYGALSVSAGRVRVEWQIINDPARGRSLEFSWIESHGPPVAPPAREGFGTQLIRGMIGYELGGTAEVQYRPDGAKWRLTIPLQERSERPAPPSLGG